MRVFGAVLGAIAIVTGVIAALLTQASSPDYQALFRSAAVLFAISGACALAIVGSSSIWRWPAAAAATLAAAGVAEMAARLYL